MRANRATCLHIHDFCAIWKDYNLEEFFDYDGIHKNSNEILGNDFSIGPNWHIIVLSSNLGMC